MSHVIAALAVLVSISALGQSRETPLRIVSLVPAVTEMLFAIGAGLQVAGVGTFDRHPEDVARLPRVGGLLDPDLERILSLRPDLVVLYATQTEAREQIARAAIPVFVYQHGGLGRVTETIRALGQRTGHAQEADRVAGDIERALDTVRERVAGRPPVRTMLVFGREPGTLRNLYASGGIGFLHDLLELAGGRNVFGDIPRESVQPTLETVIAEAPDVIVELKYDEDLTRVQAEQEARAWRSLSSIPAVERGRIHVLSGSAFVVPGPRVTSAAAALARLLHPDAF